VFGAFVVGIIAYAGLYCFPPISASYAADFGIGRTVAVTPWTVFLLVSGLSSPLLGRAYDVFLDRQLLVAGMLVLLAGWAIAAVAPDIGLLTVAYGIFLALGLELVFVGTTTAISRRYAGRSGLALGIAYAGPSVGVAVALPIVTPLVGDLGWRPLMGAFAVATLAGLPFVWLMTSGPAIVIPLRRDRGAGRDRRAPADPAGPVPARTVPAIVGGTRLDLTAAPVAAAAPVAGPPAAPAIAAAPSTTHHGSRHGNPPAGGGLRETSAPGAIGAAREPIPDEAPPRAESLRRVLRTRRFWILFAGALAIGAVDEGAFQTFMPHAVSRGISADLAAAAMSLESVAYTVGQVVGGALSDRLGRRGVGLAMAAAMAVGITAAFSGTGDTAGIAVAGLLLHGFGMGATIAVRSAAFSDVFGGANFGAIFGVLAVGYPIGGMLPIEIGGISVDRLGNYWPVYGLVVASIAIWAVALWVAGPRWHGRRLRFPRLRNRSAAA